jgi:hypothetical protein
MMRWPFEGIRVNDVIVRVAFFWTGRCNIWIDWIDRIGDIGCIKEMEYGIWKHTFYVDYVDVMTELKSKREVVEGKLTYKTT